VSGPFSGDTVDALASDVQADLLSNGRQFSSTDSDNDSWPSDSCVIQKSGVWWFGNCSSSLLNADTNGNWFRYNGQPQGDVIYSRMLIKMK
jgi:Fibrinogen beta and gamma chains, C-terminal globular domain